MCLNELKIIVRIKYKQAAGNFRKKLKKFQAQRDTDSKKCVK
jgi:hypothetical protein